MILVTGATGHVGAPLLTALTAAGAPVRALTRRPDRVAPRPGVEWVGGDLDDPASLAQAMDGVDRLFLLSPPGGEDAAAAQVRAVDAAVAAGVRHVVKLSSIGADEEDVAAGIIRAHRAVERRIEASGLAWTHLRPNWFMQNELGQAAAVADGAFHAPDVTRVSAVHVADVAAVAARVLLEEGHEGRAYVLTGPEALSYADVAERYARVLGRPVRWVEATLEETRAGLEAAGLPAPLAQGFVEIMARYRQGGVTATVSPAVRQLLGRDPLSFESLVREHRDLYRAPAAAHAG